MADFDFHFGTGANELFPKDFTVHVGYYPVTLQDTGNSEANCAISGDYGSFGNQANGFARAGELVTVSKTTGTFGGASVVALKTSDTSVVLAAGAPVGSADNAYRFTMPGCGVTISAAATNKILTVGVKGADLDDLTAVTDVTTGKDSKIVVPDSHKWGYYFTITDTAGKFHNVGAAGAIDDAANDKAVWLSVDSQLAAIDWSKQTTGGVDYVDEYTVNVNYFKADFRVSDPTIKCEGATVGIKGKDAVEFAKWGTDGVDYVLRGTTLVVTPGATGNSFAVNGTILKTGDTPLEIIMGDIAEIEISKNESSEPVNGSAVRVAVATTTAGADAVWSANVSTVTVTATTTDAGKEGASVTVTYNDAEGTRQTATWTFGYDANSDTAAVAAAVVEALNKQLDGVFTVAVNGDDDTKIDFTSVDAGETNSVEVTAVAFDNLGTDDEITADVSTTDGTKTENAKAWAGTLTLSQSNGDAGVDTVAVITYIEAGERKSAEITFKTGADAAATGTNFSTAVASSVLNSLFDVTGTSPALTFTAKTAGADKAEIVSVTIQ